MRPVGINSRINFFSFLLLITQQLHAQEIIPFTADKQGHLFVKAKVNDVEGNFIFDTGGGLTVLTKNFASKIKGLSKQDGGFTGYRATGEKMDIDLYTVEKLTIGNFIQKKSTLAIIDIDFGKIDGLISMTSFQKQPFTIDFVNNILYLETSQSLHRRNKEGIIIPLQIDIARDKSLSLFAYFKLNNKLSLQFLLDSGAGNDVLKVNAKYIKETGIDTTDTSKISKTFKQSEFNPNIKTAIYKTIVSELAFKDVSGIKRENFTALFTEGLIYDGVVSINWIGKQISFDIEKKEMIVKQ